MAKTARTTDATVSLEAVGRVVGTLKERAAALADDVAALDALLTALAEATAEPDAAPAESAPRARKAAAPAAAPARARPVAARATRAAQKDAPGRDVQLAGPRGAQARGVFRDDGVLVLQGSQMAQTTVPSMPEALKTARDDLIAGRVVTRVGRSLRFARDHFFPSVSTAAAVVMGRNANGWNEWRDADGRPLRELLRRT